MSRRVVKILVSFLLLWGPFVGCCLDEALASSGKTAILETVKAADCACADNSADCCDKSDGCLQAHEAGQKAVVSPSLGHVSADPAVFDSPFFLPQLTKPLVPVLAEHINSVPIYLNLRNLRL